MTRGQASLEYLVTYGWAFIAILLVIGVLAYLGVLSPTRYLPSTCDFGAQLICIDYEVGPAFNEGGPDTGNGRVRLQFRNNFGEDIEVLNFQVAGGTVGSRQYWNPATSTWTSFGGAPQTIQAGNVSQLFQFYIPLTDEVLLTEGDRASVPVIVSFRRKQGPGPYHNVTGNIFALVREPTILT